MEIERLNTSHEQTFGSQAATGIQWFLRHSALAYLLGCLTLTVTPAGSAGEIKIVSPGPQATTEGNDVAGFSPAGLNSPYRAQYLFPKSDFSGLAEGGWITEFRARPDGGRSGPIETTFADYHLRLSVTSKSSLVAKFDDNVEQTPQVVYSGPITFQAANVRPASGPKDFEFVTMLQQPFFYDPTLGNLLMEVQSQSGWNQLLFFDAQSGPAGVNNNRIVYAFGNSNTATGTPENFTLVAQFVIVPEPGLLAITGGLGMMVVDRRRRHRLR